MIPKTIHYCWFGRNPLPKLAHRCIESWKKFLPDYEIKEWNEDNFDVNIVPYTREAYAAKKYAFVSDYARFWILYNYGGLYFDTDVEIIRPLDDIIAKGPFMGREDSFKVNPGLGLSAVPGLSLYKEVLELYATLTFVNISGGLNLTTVVDYTTDLLLKYGLNDEIKVQKVANICIYPIDYFNPISVKDGKLRITNNTRTIHHFAQSWQSPLRKYGRKLILFIGGVKLKSFLKKLLYKS